MSDTETAERQSPPLSVQTVNSLRRKLTDAGKEVQAINECGRQAVADESKVAAFKGMFRAIDRYFAKFETFWDELVDLHEGAGSKDFPKDKDEKTRSTVQKYYYEANTNYERIFKPSVAPAQPSLSNITISENRLSETLPRINIPPFDGELTKWPRFRDTYVSLIHNDTSLPPMRKYYYLVTFLTGAAASTISHLKLEEANYELAWRTLNETYDNKRLLAAAYLNQILSFKPVQSGTSDNLKLFQTQIADNVAAFKLLNINNEAEFILFHLAIKGLDAKTRKQFEVTHKEVEFPTFTQLADFVKSQRNALRFVEPSDSKPSSSSNPNLGKSKSGRTNNSRSMALISNKPAKKVSQPTFPSCVICNEGVHKLLQCSKFYTATAAERLRWLKDWTGCKNCLSYGHITAKCTSRWSCRLCSSRHHAMLHLDLPSNNNNQSHLQSGPSSNQASLSSPQDTKVICTSAVDLQVLLGTVSAHIQDSRGNCHTIRLVIDSGSQHSFITDRFARNLGIDIDHYSRKISGIGETLLEGAKGQLECSIRPRNCQQPVLTTKAIVVKNITSFLPNTPLPIDLRERFQGYDLADPEFWNPSSIDFLLGADLFPEISLGQPITFQEDLPKLFPSAFGYIVMGKISDPINSAGISLASFSENDDLNLQLKKFWQIEEPLLIHKMRDPENEACEQHFIKTHYRLESGRYAVRLPFKTEPPNLKESISVCSRRFFNLEGKLMKNADVYIKYKDFMREYLDLGHMSLARNPSNYMLPHHSVTKEDRGQLKIRVVFDASAKTSQGSLNDYVHVGEKLQNDIRDILLNFRAYPVVFVADIEKMYRNILLDPNDRSYQHIFWRFEPSEPLQRYELNTITYGLSCAPFLALRVIRQLCIDEASNFPEAAKILERDMYVDDLVTGCYSLQETLELKQQVIGLLQRGGFTLSKWASNVPEILESRSGRSSVTAPIQLMDKEDKNIKILGLQWDPDLDSFTYKMNALSNPSIITK